MTAASSATWPSGIIPAFFFLVYRLVAIESTIRVKIADSIATKPVKGNLCHVFFVKHGDHSMSKESGNTCMNPVARMIPEANALTMMNRLRSGLKAGIEREKRGKHTPIMLVTNIEAMAISLSGSAADLLLQLLLLSDSHSSDCEAACEVKMVMRMKKIGMSFISELPIIHSRLFGCSEID